MTAPAEIRAAAIQALQGKVAGAPASETRVLRGRVRRAEVEQPVQGAMVHVPGAGAAVAAEAADLDRVTGAGVREYPGVQVPGESSVNVTHAAQHRSTSSCVDQTVHVMRMYDLDVSLSDQLF